MEHLHATGGYKPENITEKPYKALTAATYKVLSKAVNYGLEDSVVPMVMKQKLENNVFIFSGLKTHAELKEASQYLLNEAGQRTSFTDFTKKVLALNDKYNINYLEAEYLFAQQSGQMAAKWVADTATGSDKYFLQYRTASDDKVRDSHRALHNTTLPFDDAFWNSYYPPNGWRCRCTTVRVMKDKYEKSDSPAAIAAGDKATTAIGSNGKNNLAMFRFNPGKEQVIFPANHPYETVKGAKEAAVVLAKSSVITIPEGKITDGVVKRLFAEYAEKYPENFYTGFEGIQFRKSSSYMMMHSRFVNSANEYTSKSTITISTHTFLSNNFCPEYELKNALRAIRKGESLTFKQEYAFESLWHEILHAKKGGKWNNLSANMTKSMETINQFTARHTYPMLIEAFGGKAIHQKQILEEGYGYKIWVADFRKDLAKHKIEEQEALKYFEPILMRSYAEVHTSLQKYFK